MNRITNEQREAIVRKAVAERDALLDCGGVMLPISDLCPRCLRDGIKERKEDCTLHPSQKP